LNADIVGKVVNLASRTAKFISQLADEYPDDGGLFENGKQAGVAIAAAYQAFDFARAMRLVMALADRANEYLDQKQPWKLRKEPDKQKELVDVCTVALNLYRQIVVYLAPVLPELAQKSADLLRTSTQWADAQSPLIAQSIGTFEHLMQRIDPKNIEAMMNEEKLAAEASPAPAPAAPTYGDTAQALEKEPLAPSCTIDDLAKVDLRVARIVSAEQVPEAKKLIKLTVSLGGEDRRTVFAGIKAAYEPETLVGRMVVIVANLAPRQMKFGLSEGMVLCAGEGGADLFVLAADTGAQVGQRIR